MSAYRARADVRCWRVADSVPAKRHRSYVWAAAAPSLRLQQFRGELRQNGGAGKLGNGKLGSMADIIARELGASADTRAGRADRFRIQNPSARECARKVAPRWGGAGQCKTSLTAVPVWCRSFRGARSCGPKALKRMVDATGIEPVTPSMSTRCSPAELRIRQDGSEEAPEREGRVYNPPGSPTARAKPRQFDFRIVAAKSGAVRRRRPSARPRPPDHAGGRAWPAPWPGGWPGRPTGPRRRSR
jgi:hypothetical protein